MKAVWTMVRDVQPGDMYNARFVADVRTFFHKTLVVYRDGHTEYVGHDLWVTVLRRGDT